ncbi:hypothetical protein ACIRU3_38905 [Streptomyces sp. NPDC101151]|uniref:hypothetical protein n=1 Tax=Streptomyces sp. NPDC101151 TaxID=3366115 RepID=UPI00381C5EDC
MEDIPAQIAHRRREQKRRAYLAAIGKPALSADFHAAQAHIRTLYFEGGMSAEQMRRQCGVSTNIITSVIRGHRRVTRAGPEPIVRMRRTTIDRLLTVRYETPLDSKHGAGARVPPQTTLRRLQALIAHGYNIKWLAAQNHRLTGQHLSALLTRTKGQRYIMATTAQAMTELYDKYHAVDPAHVGIRPGQIEQTRCAARRRGYAPPVCWDDDTINDPHAVPEWTGACGTPDGYLIHRRERLPLCPACAVFRTNHTSPESALPDMEFSPLKLDQVLREPGRAPLRIARALGHPNGKTLDMWRQGTRRPQQRSLARLASVLGVCPEDLCDARPRTPLQPTQE